jgi:predicted PurR-regulated permease PerM
VAEFFSAFLIAVILYILSEPLVNWLTKKAKWRKNWVTIFVIVLSFFIILLPLSVFFTLIYNKVKVLLANPDSVMQGLKKINSSIEEKYHYELVSDTTINDIKSKFTDVLRIVLNQGFGFISTISMMYFFLYFMLQQRSRMEAAIVFYLPFKRDKIYMFGKELVAQTFSNAVGIPLIAALQGVLAFVCYLIIGVNQPGFWGTLTAFTSILPVVGSALVWIPMAVYLLATGAIWQGIFVLAWSAVLVTSIDNILRFMLAKRMADVHPVITVLGVILGIKYFGIVGLIFGPVLISYFIILLKIYHVEYQAKKPPQKPTAETKKLPVPNYIRPFLRKTDKKIKPPQ